jgi:hypothetical protein
MTKVTWNDIQNGTQSELKKTYKLDSRQMENHIRKHIGGANAQERRKVYQDFYSRREK